MKEIMLFSPWSTNSIFVTLLPHSEAQTILTILSFYRHSFGEFTVCRPGCELDWWVEQTTRSDGTTESFHSCENQMLRLGFYNTFLLVTDFRHECFHDCKRLADRKAECDKRWHLRNGEATRWFLPSAKCKALNTTFDIQNPDVIRLILPSLSTRRPKVSVAISWSLVTRVGSSCELCPSH